MRSNVTLLADHADARARRLNAIEAIAVRGMRTKEAAAFAGIEPATLRNLLNDERVQSYIKQMQAAHAEALNVRRGDVIRGMLDAIDHAKLVNDPSTEIRGWEAIAKLQGYNAPEKHLHDLPDDTKRLLEAMQNMNDADVAKLANMDDLIDLIPGKDFKVVSSE